MLTHPPLRVLIVDDEPLARLRLRGLVEANEEPRAEVAAEAGSGEQALAWLKDHACDLILLDVQMPGLDGLGLAQALRGRPFAPAIVFVTAHAQHALQAFELEALDYLTKPVRRERLQASLARAAQRLDERSAAKVAEQREHYKRLANISGSASVVHGGAKLEDIFQQIQAGEVATLNLIVKADVTGSLEAVTASLKKLERDEVKLSFVRQGVGGILKSDIELALASNATIIGFNVRPDRQVRELAQAEDVEIRTYEVIYHLLEDIEAAMVGMLAPEFEEVVTGEAEVREIFSVPRVGKIAGCYVTNGQITRGSKVRFLREGTIIWKGAIQSLRRFKDDVREVNQGFECGIGLTDFQDLKEGDIIETYEDREIPRS